MFYRPNLANEIKDRGDRLARRIPVPPGNQTMGQLLHPEIKPGAYRAGHSGVSAPYYGSTQHQLELR
ncbi:hypothetical protein J6590_089715 [Homalodisca vitripennis]|nr:hypothetical protein J6590_089715 [Homalodisca vitripennis]